MYEMSIYLCLTYARISTRMHACMYIHHLRLMELMYDIQQYGQPPGEIIKGLAPGLKFDVHGMPIMPNMGSGMMPEMPGGEGMPNMGIPLNNMMGGQCSVM